MKNLLSIFLIFLVIIISFLCCVKQADLPTVTTAEITNIYGQSATAGGEVTSDGGKSVYLRGVCWGIQDYPTMKNSVATSLKGMGSFIRIIKGLKPNTYYHVRAFAINDVGTAYGNEVHFTTSQIVPPNVTTNHFTSSLTMAWGGGNVRGNEGTTILEKGLCWSVNTNPTINNYVISCGAGSGTFNVRLSGLQPESILYGRAYAVTYTGLTYGNEIQFKTQSLPKVNTEAVTDFTRTSANVYANLDLEGDGFFFWNIGICFGTTPMPTIEGLNGSNISLLNDGIFSCTLKDLSPSTLYYVRAYSVSVDWYDWSQEFIMYGNEVSFTTSQ